MRFVPGRGKREAVGRLGAEMQILWQGGHVTVANSGPGPEGMKGGHQIQQTEGRARLVKGAVLTKSGREGQ